MLDHKDFAFRVVVLLLHQIYLRLGQVEVPRLLGILLLVEIAEHLIITCEYAVASLKGTYKHAWALLTQPPTDDNITSSGRVKVVDLLARHLREG